MVRRFPALLALLLLTACTGTGGHPSTAIPADQQGRIVVASGRDVTGTNGVRERLIEAWNDQQKKKGTGYSARLVELPGSADEQRSQLLGALQSGSADYDVVNLDVTWVPEFASAHLISALPDTTVDDDVITSVAATARWDDRVYAAPFNSDVGLLYYRKDYLEKAGIRQTDLSVGITWTGLKKLITSLEHSPSKDKAYESGWTTQLDGYEGRTVNAVEAFASAVPRFSLTDDAGRYTGTVGDLTAGVAELRSRTDAAYTLGDAVDSDEQDSLKDFASGRTAFLRHWPYVYRTLYQSFTERQLGVVPLPGRAVLGGQDLAVTSSSARQGKAAELIRFLTSPESERCLLDAGFAATRESAYNDDQVHCPFTEDPEPAPSASSTGERADHMPRDGAGRPAYARRVLLRALHHAVQRPRTPLYGAFTQTVISELGPLFGPAPPSDAELAKRLHEALPKALPD